MSDAARASEEKPWHARDAQLKPITVPREARRFQGVRAGVVSRMLASILDFLIVALATIGGYLVVAGLRFLWAPTTFKFPSPSFLLLLFAGALLLLFYLTVSWWSAGRTYGEYLFGLRVVNFHGERMRLSGALVRAGFCTVFPIGLLWVAVSRQNRSVQDVVLRTSVVYDWEVRPAKARPTVDPLVG
ncbi:MAG: RDD family protein [Actinomycetota bacterium]